MEPIIVSVPIYVKVGKEKTFSLNLNQYRNAHHHTLHKAKVVFEEQVQGVIKPLPTMSRLKLTYSLFFGSRRAVDTANVCCIVDKFFSDSLVNANKIPDDNTEIISEVVYRFGGIDTKNPRIDVTISDYEVVVPTQEEEPMRVILVQSEIEAAIHAYVLGQITLKDGQDVTIDFKNTRGEDGCTAEITIANPAAPAQTVGQAGTSPSTPSTPKPATAPVTPKATQPAKPVIPAALAAAPQEPAQEPAESVKADNATTTPVAAHNVTGEAADGSQVASPVEEPVEEAQTETTTEGTTETAAVVETAQEEPAAVEKPAAPAAGKSLFAGLSKPVNG